MQKRTALRLAEQGRQVDTAAKRGGYVILVLAGHARHVLIHGHPFCGILNSSGGYIARNVVGAAQMQILSSKCAR